MFGLGTKRVRRFTSVARYIAAVSGGVDSVVLLHMLVKGGHDVIVAHVEHGIRDDSAEDARFVHALAALYGCPYEQTSLDLGPNASELRARQGRYDFLFTVARRYGADIATAHHGDDLAETIAINMARGTGWRGLAVLSRPGLYRPLLGYAKADLYQYALREHLEWVEDKTNRDLRYLRNRVRARLRPRLQAKDRTELLRLRNRQVELRARIAQEARGILSQNDSVRYLLTHIEQDCAVELLGQYIEYAGGARLQRPQLERALIAVKTAQAGSHYHAGGKIVLCFATRDFSVKVLQ